MLDDEGNVALTDFGLAKYIKDDEKTNSIVGTPAYIAPEILIRERYKLFNVIKFK